jgi:hypothetical protein
MKNQPKKTKTKVEHDFIQEYNEIMEITGRNVEQIEKSWNGGGGYIKKFSLIKSTPSTIVSDHIQL